MQYKMTCKTNNFYFGHISYISLVSGPHVKNHQNSFQTFPPSFQRLTLFTEFIPTNHGWKECAETSLRESCQVHKPQLCPGAARLQALPSVHALTTAVWEPQPQPHTIPIPLVMAEPEWIYQFRRPWAQAWTYRTSNNPRLYSSLALQLFLGFMFC